MRVYFYQIQQRGKKNTLMRKKKKISSTAEKHDEKSQDIIVFLYDI